jgi:hypothetical protein
MDSPVLDKYYQHYRNKKYYKIVEIGRHTEMGEEMVVYKAQYDDPVYGSGAVWIRPKKMFCELVEYEGVMVPRFKVWHPESDDE